MANDSYNLLGQVGSIDLNSSSGATTFGTTALPHKPRVLQALNGAVAAVSAITDDKNSGDLLTSLGVGGTAYGQFSQIPVSSGTIRCYF